MDKATDITLLEQYLRGALSEQAIFKLKIRLEKEPLLANQLRELKEVQNGIRYARLASNLAEIRSWEINEESTSAVESDFEKDVADMIRIEKNRELLGEIQGFEEEKKHTIVYNKYWLIAASFIFTIGLGLFLMTYVSQTESGKLIVEYYDSYPVIGNTRGNNKNKIRLQAFGDYIAGDYQKAIEGFENLTVANDSLITFYLGVAYLGNNNPKKCIKTLQFFQKKYNFLETQSNWYIGLANFKLDNKKEAIKYLQKVVESKEYKAKESTEIISQLERH